MIGEVVGSSSVYSAGSRILKANGMVRRVGLGRRGWLCMSVELRYPQASAEVREAAQSGPVEDSLGRLTKS